jgi:hypothetical protein
METDLSSGTALNIYQATMRHDNEDNILVIV